MSEEKKVVMKKKKTDYSRQIAGKMVNITLQRSRERTPLFFLKIGQRRQRIEDS